MRWHPDPDDRAAWSAVGGVVTATGAGGAVAWLLAVQPSSPDVPKWPVYAFAAVAVVGLYGMLAPLLCRWPWREPPKTRPALHISAGLGPEFQICTSPETALANKMLATPGGGVRGGNAVEQITWVLKVAETNNVWAKDVGVRITESDPPPREGMGSLPEPLKWHATSRPPNIDIAPAGLAYVVLLDAVRFEGGEGSDWGLVLPITDWGNREIVNFTVEVFDSQGVLGRGQFRMDKPMQANPNDSRDLIGLPVVAEICKVAQL